MKHAASGMLGILVAVLFLWVLAQRARIPLSKEDGVAVIITVSLMLLLTCLGALRKGL